MKHFRMMITVSILVLACTSFSLAAEKSLKGTAAQSVKASSYSYSKIRVSWDLMEGADGYIVYRSSSEKGTYKKVYTTDNPEKNWYINTNRKSGQTWWYKVRGYKLVDGRKIFSKYSVPVSAYARPERVQINSIGSSGFIYRSLDLNWSSAAGASGYQVYMKTRDAEKFSFVGNFKETEASVGIPDTTKEYDLKVRAYRMVDGKKVYGKFSDAASYEFDWSEDELVDTGISYILKQWPDTVFNSTLSDGQAKTPYNGTSWLAVWPKRFSLYEPWEDVKAELLAAIDADVKMQGQNPQDVCFYVTPDNDENWVTVYLLS
ncbi:MAG: hypothetical protein IKT31_05150 [Firmicutes bacterium]|nr:hypothetical protein [Bacillota bacterium]